MDTGNCILACCLKRVFRLPQQKYVEIYVISNAKPQLFRWDIVDACLSENSSWLIPKAPGIGLFPASLILYVGESSGTALSLPRC